MTWTDGSLDQEDIENILRYTHEFTFKYKLVLQYFASDATAGPEHILSSLLHALRAESEERSRTRDISLDILRYSAGERQIRSAISSTGLRKGLGEYICLVFIPNSGKGHPEPSIIRNTVFAFIRRIGFKINERSEGYSMNGMDALERTAMVDMKL